MRALDCIPLFVRIAFLWWIILFSYPPTRPLLFYSLRWKSQNAALPYLVALSIVHVLVASWIVVRVLTKRRAGQDSGSVVRWTLALWWFAVTTGSCLLSAVRGAWRPMLHGDLAAAGSALWTSLIVIPFLALIAWGVTWIIWALALSTVLIVRRSTTTAVRPYSGGTPPAPASGGN